MVDKVNLSRDETFIVDTATNIVSFAIIFGHVQIQDVNGNVLANLNDSYDIYTLPANSGTYKVVGAGEFSGVYVFRSFYI